jgi:GNAT superfamily N-acetyltransferase
MSIANVAAKPPIDCVALICRRATERDGPAMRALVAAAIDELQRPFLDAAQIAASHRVMGIDSQLIADGTYFVVEAQGRLAGCGGWSRRAALIGGDHTADLGDQCQVDPASSPAKVRAMYTHPNFARRGVGRMILARCEAEAAAEGFRELELMATMAGRPLYAAAGFVDVNPAMVDADGIAIPVVIMRKSIAHDAGQLPPGFP